MAAMPDDVRQYYTVGRLRWLLSIYPYMALSSPPKDPDVRVMVKRAIGDAHWTEAAAKRADIQQAIFWLNERDWRAAYVVRASYIVGLSERDIKSYLDRQGVNVHHSTIHRWKVDGLSLLCAYLNGRLGKAQD